jgi:hypothetical protein
MPEYLRSLPVVLFIATTVFLLTQRGLSPLMQPGAFARRRNAFLALTACAFLAPSFWLYAVAATVVVILASIRERNIPALFFSLLFAVPPAAERIPGLGLVNYLLALDHPRLLAIVLLLPAAVVLFRRSFQSRLTWPDRVLTGYLLLQATLVCSRSESFTNGLRELVYLTTDVFLPYYVVSRTLSNIEQLRDAFAAFCLAGLVLAAIAIFESLKNWLVYRSLLDHWAAEFGMGNYLLREGIVRALATTGQPIVLGFVLATALACFLAVRSELKTSAHRNFAGAFFVGGLLATFSRGPWLAALVVAFAFWAAANSSRMRLALGLAVITSVAVLFDTQFPLLSAFTGVDQSTVDYRRELLSNSLEIFFEHPWLGSDIYPQRLAAKGMLQGQGIVDVVNIYLGVALSSGAVGLILFLSLIATVLLGVWKSRRGARRAKGTRTSSLTSLTERTGGSEFSASLAARALIAGLAGMAVCIGSASSISFIPWVFWAWIGAAVAYIRIATGAASLAFNSSSNAVFQVPGESTSRPVT